LNSEGIPDAAVQFFDFAKSLNVERTTEYIDVTILSFLDISPDPLRSVGIENP
jgi:hypothetical protein